MADDNRLQVELALVADKFKSGLSDSSGAIADFLGTTKGHLAAAATAAAGVVTVFGALTKSAADYGVELGLTAQKIGISVEALSGLKYAAALDHLEFEQLSTGIKIFSTRIEEAALGIDKGAQAFSKLHLTAVDAHGTLLPTEELLLQVAEKFHGMADGAIKASLATDLFGRSGYQLIPFLNKGREGLTALIAEAQRLGLTLTTEQVEAAQKFDDALFKMKESAKGTAIVIGTDLVEAFNKLSTVLVPGGVLSTSVKALWFEFRSIGIALHVILAEVLSLGDFNLLTSSGRAAWKAFALEMEKVAEEEKVKLAAELAGIPMPGEGGGAKKKPLEVLSSGKGQEFIGHEIVRQAKQAYDALVALQNIGEAGDAELVKRLGLNKDELDAFLASRKMMREADAEYYENLKKAYDKSIADEHDAMVSRVSLEIDAMNEIIRHQTTFATVYTAGLEKFINDTESGLGLAQRAAQQTAREMAGAFNTLFFNVFTGRVTSLRDVLLGLRDTAARITSSVLSEIATVGVLKAVVPVLQSLFGIATAAPKAASDAAFVAAVGTFDTGVGAFGTGVGAFGTGVGVFDTGVGTFGTGIVAFDSGVGAFGVFVDEFVAAVVAQKAPLAFAERGWDVPWAARGWDIPSAAGGMDGKGGFLSMLHPREMVLPAELANKIRAMTNSAGEGGGGNGGIHFHINAVDAKSVERLFMDHNGALGKALREAHRDGKFSLGAGKG